MLLSTFLPILLACGLSQARTSLSFVPFADAFASAASTRSIVLCVANAPTLRLAVAKGASLNAVALAVDALVPRWMRIFNDPTGTPDWTDGLAPAKP